MKNSLISTRNSLTKEETSAFSLVEVLAAITIIGVITFLAIPNLVQIKKDGEENLAIARAEAANMAIAGYIQGVGMNSAVAGWTSAGSGGRYALIRPYLAYAPTNQAAYMPGGYSPSFTNELSTNGITKVGLSGPSGVISY